MLRVNRSIFYLRDFCDINFIQKNQYSYLYTYLATLIHLALFYFLHLLKKINPPLPHESFRVVHWPGSTI